MWILEFIGAVLAYMLGAFIWDVIKSKRNGKAWWEQ